MNTRELIRLVYSALEWNEDGSIDDAKAIALLDLELPVIEPSESARDLVEIIEGMRNHGESIGKCAALIELDRARVLKEAAERIQSMPNPIDPEQERDAIAAILGDK